MNSSDNYTLQHPLFDEEELRLLLNFRLILDTPDSFIAQGGMFLWIERIECALEK